MIEKFHLRHVKVETEKILGFFPTAWNEGKNIIMCTGYGDKGRRDAQKVIAKCLLKCTIEESKRLGSIDDLKRWSALGGGQGTQIFLLIHRP